MSLAGLRGCNMAKAKKLPTFAAFVLKNGADATALREALVDVLSKYKGNKDAVCEVLNEMNVLWGDFYWNTPHEEN